MIKFDIYQFKNHELYEHATTHPSAYKIKKNSKFEQLEFLGDRVLGLAVSSLLYNEYHNNEIKMMACKHAKLVSTECVAKIAKQWKLDRILRHEIVVLSQKVLADASEAMLGAIYLDSNYETVAKIIQTHWQQFISMNTLEPKMYLQELAQSRNLGIPEYETVDSYGQDHEKIYAVQVSVPELGKATGTGRSKQDASKEAARKLLELIERS